MSIVVQKYGGSSVADLKKIRAVAERIATTRAQGHDVVVVASAMGNTTNELLALAHQVCPTPDRRELDMLVSTGERVTMALLAMTLRSNGVPAVSLTGSSQASSPTKHTPMHGWWRSGRTACVGTWSRARRSSSPAFRV